jgi:putative membrane protein
VLAWRRGWLSEHDDVSPWFRGRRTRPVLFGLGVFTSFVALLSPIDTAGDLYLFSLHMLQHLLLMMVAPPLVLLGFAGLRAPAADWFPRTRRLWWAITRPWPAVLIFNAVMLVWHIPALYDTTLTTEPIHVVEHLSFLAVGIVFWWPIVDPVRGPNTKTVSPLEKIAALVVSGIPPTVLGLIFALSPTAFYEYYVHAPRLWGITPVADQQYGGVVMLGLGNIIYFIAITIIFVRLLGDQARDEAEAQERIAATSVIATGASGDVRTTPSPSIRSVAVTTERAAAPKPTAALAEGGPG